MKTYALLLLSTLVYPAIAQERRSAAVYRVEFNIHDGSDAAAKTGRRYTLLVEPGTKGTFRAGNKVPYITGPGSNGQPTYNYADVGVNIDASLQERNDGVALRAEIDLSTVLQPAKAGVPNPTIAGTRVSVNAQMTPGKAALVASADDPVTMRKFDVEATITKVD